MRSILEELYYGNINPDEQAVSKDPEYRPLNMRISKTRECLKVNLSDDDVQLLENLINLHCASSSMEAAASFSYGFKLGAMIALEVLTEKVV